RAFPTYLEWNGDKTDDTVVDAHIEDADPVLCKNIVSQAYWRVDDGSHLVRILNPNACHIIARSTGLIADDRDRQGIVAVEFSIGRGHVLHLVGHFDNNSGLAFANTLPDPAPVIGISLRQAI